jgi:hypothetical protein
MRLPVIGCHGTRTRSRRSSGRRRAARAHPARFPSQAGGMPARNRASRSRAGAAGPGRGWWFRARAARPSHAGACSSSWYPAASATLTRAHTRAMREEPLLSSEDGTKTGTLAHTVTYYLRILRMRFVPFKKPYFYLTEALVANNPPNPDFVQYVLFYKHFKKMFWFTSILKYFKGRQGECLFHLQRAAISSSAYAKLLY